MKFFAVLAIATVSSMADSAQAQTAIQPGLWETNDKTSLEGVQPTPATSRQMCLKGNEAQLERLLFPSPEEIAKHGCKYEGALKQTGVLQSSLSCPPADIAPGIDAKAEITFTQTSYEGLGQLLLKDKSGTTVKGSSTLSGKRVGDC
ncbi:MAG: DUF3617 family protein [Rhodospirillaceae bacterium]|nr:DUF3617 family protein [Rhodospirillaceae bacterium]